MNHFIENADFVSITVALVLLLMSITSWVVIIVKSWLLIQAKKQIPQAIAAFWQAPDLESACQASAAFDKKGFLNPLLDTVKNDTNCGCEVINSTIDSVNNILDEIQEESC